MVLSDLEYSVKQIEDINKRLSGNKAERAVLAFHGVRMYDDARNYIEHVKALKFR